MRFLSPDIFNFETKTAYNNLNKTKIQGFEPWTSKQYKAEVSLSSNFRIPAIFVSILQDKPLLIYSSESLEYGTIFSSYISNFEIQRI